MKKILRLVLVSLFVLLGTWPGVNAAAQEAAIHLRIDQVDLTGYPDVSIHLRAWDSAGLPLPALRTVDINLREDQGAPFPPDSVALDLEAPVRVALVLDVSGSMVGQPLVDAKQAAARFLDRLKPGDEVALIAFSDSVNPDPAVLDPARELAFTSDLSMVYDTIESLKSENKTHLYLALGKALQMIAQTPADRTRVVLLLTDGRNEPENVGDPQEPIRLAQESDVPIFVIGLGNQIDEQYLRELAGKSAGLLLTTPRSSELAALFGGMADLFKTQYLLGYRSALSLDGSKHTLTIELNTSLGNAESRVDFGPLASSLQNTAPTATNTKVPPVVATQPPQKIDQPPPTPANNNWIWLVAAAIAIGLGLLISVRRRRSPRPNPQVCAQCGYDLTGASGACPQCGGTRRLPKVR